MFNQISFGEKIVDIIKIGEAVFEIIEKPETILAGRIIYAKDYADINAFYDTIGVIERNQQTMIPFNDIIECTIPISDRGVSINIWRDEEAHGFGFVRETATEHQPEGVDIYINPASLYIRAYTNKHTTMLAASDKYTAMLETKEQCDIWDELFSYIRNDFMPMHGFAMAENGAQEIEVYDTAEHKTGYTYMPVKRV